MWLKCRHAQCRAGQASANLHKSAVAPGSGPTLPAADRAQRAGPRQLVIGSAAEGDARPTVASGLTCRQPPRRHGRADDANSRNRGVDTTSSGVQGTTRLAGRQSGAAGEGGRGAAGQCCRAPCREPPRARRARHRQLSVARWTSLRVAPRARQEDGGGPRVAQVQNGEVAAVAAN